MAYIAPKCGKWNFDYTYSSVNQTRRVERTQESTKNGRECSSRVKPNPALDLVTKMLTTEDLLKAVREKVKPMKDEDDPEMDDLREYEQIRIRNIRRKEALFAELGLEEAKREAREASGVKEESESADLEGLTIDTDETEEGLGGMDSSWDEEEQHDAEGSLNPTSVSPRPASNLEDQDKLILNTMGFSSFGNPNYQRRNIQSEAWTRWTVRKYANAEELTNVEAGEEPDIEAPVDAVDVYRCRLCYQTSAVMFELWDHLQEPTLNTCWGASF